MYRAVLLLAAAIVVHGADPASRDWYRAIRENRISEIESMASSASALQVRDARGTTPLMYAAAVGSAESVELLLEAGSDANARNGLDVTPLHFAVSDIRKVRLLLQAGADVNAVSKGGRTPLIVAAARPGSIEVVRLLLSKGADPKASDQGKFTPLLLAAEMNETETVRLLLSKPHDINAADGLGFTALFAATGHGNLPMVKMLLAKGADVNAATPTEIKVRAGKIAISEMTPLMLATTSSPEAIQTLLKAGAKVNARDVRGMTPLMFAAATDTPNLSILRMLLEAGADKEIKSTDNETAGDWARKFNNSGVVEAMGIAPARIQAALHLPGSKKRDLGASIAQSLQLLQSASTEYFKQSGCVGCHHQPVVGLAVERAFRKGLHVDTAARAEQLRVVRTEFHSRKDNLYQGIFISVDSLVFSIMHLIEAEHPADDLTDALVSAIASKQEPDGSWAGLPVSRPPLEASVWVRTAMAARALARYPIPARGAEFAGRLAKAQRWLAKSRPAVPYERSYQLLGLAWSKAPVEQIQRAAAEVKQLQQTNGGWAQTDSLAADAFATGLAMQALAEAGMSPRDPTYNRGVEYLLTTQKADGSWHVPSRSPKLQPYFQSGFPHDHDQWISVAATGLAAAALCEAVQPAQRTAGLP